jgi:hypothetical protein
LPDMRYLLNVVSGDVRDIRPTGIVQSMRRRRAGGRVDEDQAGETLIAQLHDAILVHA